MKSIQLVFVMIVLAMATLVGCGNNSTPTPPAIPTVSGLPAEEPTLEPNRPPDGYPAPELIPTIDPGSYPAPELIPTIDPASYPAP